MIRYAGLLLALGTVAGAAPEGWTSDFEAAKKQAAAEKKDLLIDFTGSDWCGWCIKLKKEVFDEQAFKDGVKDKFVLVEIDFPQDESKLTPEVKLQNEKLQETYAVQGFPTIILADAAGRPYATTGYKEGGSKAYLPHLDELRATKTAGDEKRAAAAKLAGPEKAAALAASLEGLSDTVITQFYPEVLAAIKEADPKDTSGFVKRIEGQAAFAAFETEIRDLFMKQDIKGAAEKVDKALAEKKFEGEFEQQVIFIKMNLLVAQGKFDEAIKTVDEAAKAAPNSPIAAEAEGFKAQIEQLKKQAAAGGGEAPAAE
jgi:thiol-disulfide isomerase/thioredoxin